MVIDEWLEGWNGRMDTVGCRYGMLRYGISEGICCLFEYEYSTVIILWTAFCRWAVLLCGLYCNEYNYCRNKESESTNKTKNTTT